MIGVQWTQHPVGHGGFHTGVMTSPDSPPFTWIFDCGSRRTAKFDIYLRRWLQRNPQPIDWLFISHFDLDHVSGLEELMRSAVVVDVMVPYMNERELATLLLFEAGRGSLTRILVELTADPAAFFLSRGAEGVTFVDGSRSEGFPGEDGPREPPSEDKPWNFKCTPPPRILSSPQWAKIEAGSGPAVRMIASDSDLSIAHAREGLRFKPYRAPLDTASHNALIGAIQAATGGTLTVRGRPGLGDLAYSVARHARTPAGRKQMRDLFKAHVGSSNRSSLSLLSIPVTDFNGCRWHASVPFEPWKGGTEPPAWLNTGDAEIKAPADLDDWEDCFEPDLDDVRMLALPHHGSDHNSDAALQNLCPNATFTAHVKSTAKKHPGPDVALAAGSRLLSVTEDPATKVEMWFRSP
ncbi:MAG: MBL fold metallo-hydrolase [Qipengyuania pacifica]|jgi:hypothetical protein|tara:strand:- start:14473 stop:15696 length:1224 start_codon:yes stop_codon:yes gene_type:complete